MSSKSSLPGKMTSKKWVEENRHIFTPFINKSMRLKINGRDLAKATFQSLEATKVSQWNNAPEKRIDINKKQYTPMCFTLRFDCGDLVFVIEDTNIQITMTGLQLVVGKNIVQMNIIK